MILTLGSEGKMERRTKAIEASGLRSRAGARSPELGGDAEAGFDAEGHLETRSAGTRDPAAHVPGANVETGFRLGLRDAELHQLRAQAGAGFE